MKTIIKVLICAVIVDFFFFSSVFSFTRGINTKLILGVLGLAVFFIKSAHSRAMSITRQMVILLMLAACVSITAYFSMIYNNTRDDAYATYIISMLVWLAAAYMVVVSVEFAFGKVSIPIIADFIIALSFAQCAIALLGTLYEPVNNFIKLLMPGTGWLDSVDRMYGLGDTTALDTGGIRYSIACVFCSYMLVNAEDTRRKLAPWYITAYAFITIVGNMIARTTTIGAVIALVYLFFHLFTKEKVRFTKIRNLGWITAILTVMIYATVYLYNTNDTIHKNLRFAFEGFFSLAETGKWQVNSNDKLLSMYVFPENSRTWLIGDGYFNNPDYDPNYLGEYTQGYYMDTDVGYLRFIFYFGAIGLFFFSAFILYAGYLCLIRFPGNALLFLSLLSIHFIIWLKVSTDCFFIFAVFLAMSYLRDNALDSSETPILH